MGDMRGSEERIVPRGREIYERRVRPELRQKAEGAFVVIDRRPSSGALLKGIVICPSENGHLTYTLSPGGRVCYLRNASGRRA